MKYIQVLICLMIIIFSGCKDKAQRNESNAIEGNWVLVSTEINGRKIPAKRYPAQFKTFCDGFASFIMYDSIGNFFFSGAGPYQIDGNMYKETFTFCSDTTFINSEYWQHWELKNDTLIFYGFDKAILAGGKDITDQYKTTPFIEKRVRITSGINRP